MNIVLLGDSIFDNMAYVGQGECVEDLLNNSVTDSTGITLLAKDGDVTIDVIHQIDHCPDKADLLIISCGGNDALLSIGLLNQPSLTIGESLTHLHQIREAFRNNYQTMLAAVLELKTNIVVCTIYNKTPGIEAEALTAMALFNEIILEEAFRNNLPVIDLRTIFDGEGDFSSISPIEPSLQGGKKIVRVIHKIINDLGSERLRSKVYC